MRWPDGLRAIQAVTSVMAAAGAWLGWARVVLAASPSPGAGAGGDPRSSGEGPGLVGDPLLAILVVVAIGVASLALTLVYVRASGGPQRAE